MPDWTMLWMAPPAQVVEKVMLGIAIGVFVVWKTTATPVGCATSTLGAAAVLTYAARLSSSPLVSARLQPDARLPAVFRKQAPMPPPMAWLMTPLAFAEFQTGDSVGPPWHRRQFAVLLKSVLPAAELPEVVCACAAKESAKSAIANATTRNTVPP